MTNLCIFLNPRRHSRFSSKFLELLLILIGKRSISAFLDHFPLLQICMESIPQFRCAAYAENKPYRMILLIDPSVVMAYALEGNNYDLMNKSAPLLVGRSSVKMVELFKTPSRIASSFKYLQKWDNVVQMALSLSESRKVSQYYFEGFLRRGCDGCRSPTSDDTTLRIMRKLGKGVKSLCNLGDAFGILYFSCCSTEIEDIRAWRIKVERAIEDIPSFTDASIVNSSHDDR
ncbi:hypothetical protein H2248_011209 [Termitomyces sp. 'cryptogamus']|nr:hypothetical protein H2248_011209 [Termitomyces sp. 'cryptogamus']